jgi:chaperonin GroES
MATETQQEKKVSFKPLQDRVLVQRTEAETKMKGGLVLPDTAKKKSEAARVIAVGAGKADSCGKISPMPVKVGDLVLMDKYSGQEVSIEGQEYVIVRASDIIAIIE